jgi:hypothetical protein
VASWGAPQERGAVMDVDLNSFSLGVWFAFTLLIVASIIGRLLR